MTMNAIGFGVPLSGATTGVVETYEAGETIGGNRLVMLSGGQVFKFDPTDQANYDKQVGFTITSVTSGNPVSVRRSGIMNNPGWGLTPDALYYAVADGLISVTPPTSNISVCVGVAIDADNLEINIENSVILN